MERRFIPTVATLCATISLACLLAACEASSPTGYVPDEPSGNPGGPSGAEQTIYSFANGCYTLQSDSGYLAADTSSGDYTLTDDAAKAVAFTLRPTALGSYLLMSSYQRAPGERGSKSLLGIRDPGGEFLDATGNFVGEIGNLIAGVGDITAIVLDPLAPGGGIIRGGGETVGGIGGGIGGINVNPSLAMVNEANDLAVWNLLPASSGRFSLTSAITGQRLAASHGILALTSATTAGIDTEFKLAPAQGCTAYPEVDTNAQVIDRRGPAIYLRDVPLFAKSAGASTIGAHDLYGYVDGHSHITAYEFIGGRVNYGDPFHKFGIDHALDDCEVNHGPQGILGIVETVTSGFNPVHETKGWPSFNFWPRHDSLQHHQSYYKWIERSYLGGLRLLVNHYTGNEILCQLNPQKQNDCHFEVNWRLQAQRLREMQDYIDAQNGGPGKGWFRIVTSPSDARRVIESGKLAVVQGIEISKIFDCGEFLDVPECTREQIVERLDAAYAAGIRHIFPIHKFDNAFGGVVPDEALGIGTILYVGNLAETGHPLEFEACPESFSNDSASNPDSANPLGIIDQLLRQLEYINGQLSQALPIPPLAPTSEHGLCNKRGITELGQFFVQELMRRRMFIEVDHSSLGVIDRILELAENNGYPGLISSHDWLYSEQLLDRLSASGGMIGRFAGARSSWVDRLIKVEDRPAKNRVAGVVGTGLATDVNGIASLPGNSGAADTPLYPFTSVDGRVRFDRQITGDHVFDLYDGRGVSHYGMYPDQIADMQLHTDDRTPAQVDQALRELFSSAEVYLRLWEATEAWKQ
ncbi:hypothetical protein [Hydrocarboniphaga effusa]|jgi:hypothetical protein|uniref:hypothetical protein n=1 Tax=Hydrocarboniphaga effusa TaxID=243629 RepID=UPI003138348F